MNYFILFTSLFLLYIVQKSISQVSPSTPPTNASSSSDSKPSLGHSSCSYYGRVQKECGLTAVGVEHLPTECSSFIYDGLTVDDNYAISDSYGGDVKTYIKNLKTLERGIFLFYGYSSNDEWYNKLNTDLYAVTENAAKESMSLKTFYDENQGISGFIFKNINLYVNGEFNYIPTNFREYLKTMRTLFSNLAFGLHVIGTLLLDNCTKSTDCFNFEFLNSALDFYVIDITNFNKCTDAFKCGIYPSIGDETYTLEKLAAMLENVKIPRDKIYFFFKGSPARPDSNKICSTTYSVLCTSPEATTTWCWDRKKGYADKGVYVKANGAGFIIENIDFIDPFNECNCNRPFSSFYYFLDGYYDSSTEFVCPLFDGNCTK